MNAHTNLFTATMHFLTAYHKNLYNYINCNKGNIDFGGKYDPALFKLIVAAPPSPLGQVIS